MRLVLVESPAKIKSLERYLGTKSYTIMATYGHVRDLPSKAGSVEPDNAFHMTFAPVDKNKKHLSAIVNTAKKASHLILATDPDREGEAISWHVSEHLKEKKVTIPTERITFNAITKEAVLEAVKQPRQINESLVDAYLARLSLDYLVGFTLSPVLWRKLPGCRSAGRVQSVALRVLCDRAAEIELFKAEEYWSVSALFSHDKNEIKAQLRTLQGTKLEKFSLPDKASADAAFKQCDRSPYTLSHILEKRVQRHPAAPFITSTLQQEASRKLGMPPTVTMRLAQQLYEGAGRSEGLITYMRTDSTNVSESAIADIRSYITQQFGTQDLHNTVRTYQKKARNAQEAHEAIRPTNIALSPDQMAGKLDSKLHALYTLIWRRTLASQMASAQFKQITYTLLHPEDDTQFKASGQTCVFKGFLKVYEEDHDNTDKDAKETDQALPLLKEGTELDLKKLTPTQHFTEPPPHYTEASLIKKLEEKGIGRPSTYARILQVLKDRAYMTLEKKKLSPTEKGRVVSAFLVHFFARYVEEDFTARMEESLDAVSRGEQPWKKVLENFWKDFYPMTQEATKFKTVDVIETVEQELRTHLFGDAGKKACPTCDKGTLHLRLGSFGPFLGCNRYPDCKHIHNLENNADATSTEKDGEDAPQLPRTLGTDETGLDITVRKGPYGFYLQWGEGKKPKRVTIPKNMNPYTLSHAEANQLGRLPFVLGQHPETGMDISAGIGRFGPYVKHNNVFTSVKDIQLILNNHWDAILELIRLQQEKKKKPRKK